MPRGKRQELLATRASLLAAVAYSVIDVVEEVYDEDVELWEIGVSQEALEPPRGGVHLVRVSYPGRRGVLGEREVRAAGTVVRVVSEPEWVLDYSLETLYRTVAMAPLRRDARLIRAAALETTRTGVEFMFIYTADGYLAVLEGEEYRVRIPFVRAVAAYHTHPEGSCGLSNMDVQSAADLLAEGGVAEAAATPSCAVVVYRIGLLSEDDYMELRRIALGKRPSGRPMATARVERVSY